jgi:nuclear transport factor 2 (NTF2) superfamily protein
MGSPHSVRERDRSTLNDHFRSHPNTPVAHQSWADDQTLHVAVAYSNPCRWRTRRELFENFRRHVAGLPNVRLYVGELAYGDRNFEVTSKDHPYDFQWRTRHELWHKENILNQVIERFDDGWEYGAYLDGDFTFTRQDVMLETVHKLQHYDWVQMYSTYSDLSHNHRPMRIMKSFAHKFSTGELTAEMLADYGRGGYGRRGVSGVGTTGGAWAFRRASFEACGRLLDTCILGSGDWHMAFGLVGLPDVHPNIAELTKTGQAYADSIKVWQNRAARAVRRNVGCVDCHAIHHWHGSKQRRAYGERWKILRDHAYDPERDIFRDARGIYQLTADKPGLRDDIRRYFTSRVEDDISLLGGDQLLGQ